MEAEAKQGEAARSFFFPSLTYCGCNRGASLIAEGHAEEPADQVGGDLECFEGQQRHRSGRRYAAPQPPHDAAVRLQPGLTPGSGSDYASRAWVEAIKRAELDRKLRYDHEYDFYDFAQRKATVLCIPTNVIHLRPVASTPSTPRSLGSDDSAFSLPPRRKSAYSERLNRAATLSNHERITRWGVLTGKLIHCKVMDFTAVTENTIHKTRLQASKATILNSVRERARLVVLQAMHLAKFFAKEPEDALDSEWHDPNLLTHLFSTEFVDTLVLVGNAARKVLASQPLLVEATVPCRVFGDLHGQLRDLLLLFRAFGGPKGDEGPTFVFNGDFVDRGCHQLAVVGLLLSLKVLWPEKVWLIRGNHEDRYMNERYGFRKECDELLGVSDGGKIFEAVQNTFDQMPIACRIADRVLVVHGGLGDGAWKLSDLHEVRRPLTGDIMNRPENRWVLNILWSDPIEDGEMGVFGVHASPRGEIASQFAWNVTKTFCARNGLSLVVRSHQSKHASLGIEVMHEHMLIRVFSARDYEGHGNDAAVLMISGEADVSNAEQLLTVRSQVLRSVTKARGALKNGNGQSGTRRKDRQRFAAAGADCYFPVGPALP